MSANLPQRNLRYAATKLAFDVPELRPYLFPLLTRLVVAKEFPSEEALKKYLDEHPGADRKQHTVKKTEDESFDFPEDKKPRKPGPKEESGGSVRKRPPAGRSGWSAPDDQGNVYYGKAEIVGDLAKVKDSKLAGKVSGNATVEKSSTSVGSRIGENAEVRNSDIEGLVEIGGEAKVSDSKIDAHRITIGGDTVIERASIRGGDWDGQKVTGGQWHDSYDQAVIDILSKFNDKRHPYRAGSGDGVLRAMSLWFADGGRTKGLLGGKKKRKKLEKQIAEHLQIAYPGRKRTHEKEGLYHLSKLSDEDFEKLMEVAQAKADEIKSKERKGKKGSMSNTLRRDLIRLAAANSEVRPYVLPLLTAAKVPADAKPVPGTDLFVSTKASKGPIRGQKPQFKIYTSHGGVIGGSPRREEAVAKAKAMHKKKGSRKTALTLTPGNGWESSKSNLRIHRYMDSIRVTDLTNAGKRGKKVDEFAVYDLDYAEDKGAVDRLASQLLKQPNYDLAKSLAGAWVEYYDDIGKYPHPKMSYLKLRGVDVAPADFKPIKLETPHVSIEADYRDWTIRDKYDQNNLPACTAQGAKSVKQFYRWVQDNQARLKRMPFRDIVKALSKEGIKFRQWCRMD